MLGRCRAWVCAWQGWAGSQAPHDQSPRTTSPPRRPGPAQKATRAIAYNALYHVLGLDLQFHLNRKARSTAAIPVSGHFWGAGGGVLVTARESRHQEPAVTWAKLVPANALCQGWGPLSRRLNPALGPG